MKNTKNHNIYSYWAVISYVTGSFNKIINQLGNAANYERLKVTSKKDEQNKKVASFSLIDGTKVSLSKENKNITPAAWFEHLVASAAFGLINISSDSEYESLDNFEIIIDFNVTSYTEAYTFTELFFNNFEKVVDQVYDETVDKISLESLKNKKIDYLKDIIRNNPDLFPEIIDMENFESFTKSRILIELGRNENVFEFKQIEKQTIRVIISFLMEYDYNNSVRQINISDKDVAKIEKHQGKRYYIQGLYENRRINELIDKITKIHKGSNKYFINHSKKSTKDTIVLSQYKDNNEFKQLQNSNIHFDYYNVFSLFYGTEEKFYFPLMQREYVWPRKLITNLIEDIHNADEPYYIGNILTSKRDSSKNGNLEDILDGQQRVISISIILSALNFMYKHYSLLVESDIRYPKEFDKLSNPQFLTDKFDKSSSSMSDYRKFLMILDPTNDVSLKALKIKEVFSNNTSVNLLTSKSRIEDNFYQAIYKLMNIIGDEPNNIEIFTKKLLNNIVISKLRNNEADAFKLFERLNTSSIKLNSIELMKNAIFSMIDRSVIDEKESEVVAEFNMKVLNLFKKGGDNAQIDNPKVNKFVKYIITITKDKAHEGANDFEKLLSAIKKGFGFDYRMDFQTYINKLSMLSNEINIFNEISDSDKFLSSDSAFKYFSDILFGIHSKNVYWPLIREIIVKGSDIGTQQPENITYNKTEKEKIRKLLLSIEKYEVLVRVVSFKGSSLRTNISKMVNALSKKEFAQWKNEEVSEMFADKEIMGESNTTPTIKQFENSLNGNIGSAKTMTTILNRIELFAKNEGKLFGGKLDISIRKGLTLEHIMPQNDENWSSEIKEYIEKVNEELENPRAYNDIFNEHINMLGNGLLLDKDDNSKISNISREEKSKEYEDIIYLKQSNLYIGFEIKGLESTPKLSKLSIKKTFNFNDICNRNKELKEIATYIYSLM